MRSVLAAVRAGDHLTVEEIAASAHERIGSISTQAVYDVLAALVRIGLVRRIELAGSLARFETGSRTTTITSSAAAATPWSNVDCAVGHAPCLEASSAFGYAIDEAEIIYWGLCPACRIDSCCEC